MVEDPSNGYIKISREIFKGRSKTFNSMNIFQRYSAFVLISMANYKDTEWWDKYQKKFITIKRGSFVSSVEKIRKSLRSRSATTRKIRTLLGVLQTMQFLTIKTTKHYSIITIMNYDFYQDGDSYRAKEKTKERQMGDKATPTTKKGKKGKNGKKEDTLSSKVALIINYLNEKTGRNEAGQKPFDPKKAVSYLRARFNEGRTVKDCIDVIDIKLKDWLDDEKMFEYLRPSTLFRKTNFENYITKKRPDKFDKYLKKE